MLSNILSLETQYGWLDYHYEISEKYPNGLLILMGGYIYKDERRHGRYSEMLSALLESYPIGTIVQAAIAHRGLISLFKRLGFEKVERIEYWGTANYPVQKIT